MEDKFSEVIGAVLQSGYIAEWKQDILLLSLVNHAVLQVISAYASNFTFSGYRKTLVKKKVFKFHYYQPKHLCNAYSSSFLPPHLTHLSFNADFAGPVSPGQLPSSIVHLRFGKSFHGSLEEGVLPAGLVLLILGDRFNSPLPRLPEGLKYLWLGASFNQLISTLPPVLVYLSFGFLPQPLFLWEWYDNAIRELRLNDTFMWRHHRKASHAYDHPLPLLPPSLTHLTLGNSFNHPLTTFLPDNSITFLRLGTAFHHPIPFLLLPRLEKLVIGHKYPLHIPAESLPPSLVSIIWPRPQELGDLSKCTHITTLSLEPPPPDPKMLPPSLTHLCLHSYDRNLSTYHHQLFLLLPALTSLTHLLLRTDCHVLELENSYLPTSLTHLHVHSTTRHQPLLRLYIHSTSLTHLTLAYGCDMIFYLPKLTHFAIGDTQVQMQYPSNVTHVAYGPRYSFSFLPKLLAPPIPDSVTHLKLNPKCHGKPTLPPNLTDLIVCSSKTVLEVESLPASLRRVSIPSFKVWEKGAVLPEHLEILKTNVYRQGFGVEFEFDHDHLAETRNWPIDLYSSMIN